VGVVAGEWAWCYKSVRGLMKVCVVSKMGVFSLKQACFHESR